MIGSSDTRHMMYQSGVVASSLYSLPNIRDTRDVVVTCSVINMAIILLAGNPALNQSTLHVLSPKSIQVSTYL